MNQIIKTNETVFEVWKPTAQLRFVEKSVPITEYSGTIKNILQQLFTSNLGNTDWRDVPLVEIE